MKISPCTFGLCLALSLAATQAADDFRLREKVENLPEIGEVRRSILTSDDREFSFVRPAGWSLKLDAGARKATFQSRDFGSTIVMQLTPENRAAAKSDEWRRQVTERFPEAHLDEMFPCYTDGLQGQAFDLREERGQNLVVCYRVAFVPFEGGTMEFTLITSSRMAPLARHAFGVFLTSLKTDSVPTAAGKVAQK
jgi:hypothetical protein